VTTKDALDFLLSEEAQRFPNMEPIVTNAKCIPGEHGCEKLHPNKLAPAVLASGPPVLHYAENRVLNVRETAALQSFPFDYTFCGTQKQQKKQAGNAVPVEFARALARATRDSLRLVYAHELAPDETEEGANGKQEGGEDITQPVQDGLKQMHMDDEEDVTADQGDGQWDGTATASMDGNESITCQTQEDLQMGEVVAD